MISQTSLLCLLLLGTLAAGGCGTTPHREALPDSTALNGKSQAWFHEHWGTPGAKSKRFFGGETWVYFRLAGDQSSLPLADRASTECHIRLDFDREGQLEDSGYAGC